MTAKLVFGGESAIATALIKVLGLFGGDARTPRPSSVSGRTAIGVELVVCKHSKLSLRKRNRTTNVALKTFVPIGGGIGI